MVTVIALSNRSSRLYQSGDVIFPVLLEIASRGQQEIRPAVTFGATSGNTTKDIGALVTDPPELLTTSAKLLDPLAEVGKVIALPVWPGSTAPFCRH